MPLVLSASWLLFAAVLVAVFGPRLSERLPAPSAYAVAALRRTLAPTFGAALGQGDDR